LRGCDKKTEEKIFFWLENNFLDRKSQAETVNTFELSFPTFLEKKKIYENFHFVELFLPVMMSKKIFLLMKKLVSYHQNLLKITQILKLQNPEIRQTPPSAKLPENLFFCPPINQSRNFLAQLLNSTFFSFNYRKRILHKRF
jgi:hypothetical protein